MLSIIYYKKWNIWLETHLEMKKWLQQLLEKLFVIMEKDNLDINMKISIIGHRYS